MFVDRVIIDNENTSICSDMYSLKSSKEHERHCDNSSRKK